MGDSVRTSDAGGAHGTSYVLSLDDTADHADMEGPQPGRPWRASEIAGAAVLTLGVQLSQAAKSFIEVTGLTDYRRLFPIVTWIRRYNREKFVGDLVAGMTVGLMVIPQGMAYANLAGLPPAFGLYSSFMGVFVYIFTGTSKDITLGPTALMSLIVSEAFTELEEPHGFANQCADITDESYCCLDGDDYLCTPVNLAVAATLIAGCYQMAMGVLNFGFIVDYIGMPVLSGFQSAAAIIIFTSQIRHILGLSNIDRHWTLTVRDLCNNIGETRWQDFVMGAVCMFLTHYLRGVTSHYKARRYETPKFYALWLMGTARNTLVILLAGVVSRIVGATSAGDTVFKLVGDVPSGLPTPANPLRGLGGSDMSDVMTASIVMALLGYLEAIAIGKVFSEREGYNLDPTQEMRAIGLGNVVSSFFSSYTITGSFSRTAVNYDSNVQTPMGGVFTGLLVILSLELLTSAFFWIPKAALGAIIMMSVVHMVDTDGLRRIVRTSPQDLLVWMTSFLACLLWSLEFGIIVAIAVSVCITMYNGSSQQLLRLRHDEAIDVWVPDTRYNTEGLPKRWGPRFVADAADDVLVLKVTGTVDFAMSATFRDRFACIARNFQGTETTRAIVVDLSAVGRLDYTGVLGFEYVLRALQPGRRKVRERVGGKEAVVQRNFRGIRLHVAGVTPAVEPVLRKAGLVGGHVRLGDWRVIKHASIEAALDALKDDVAMIEAEYPWPWDAPAVKMHNVKVGDVQTGRDGRAWIVAQKGKTDKIWARSAGGQGQLKMSCV